MKLFFSNDLTMHLVRQFEEKVARAGQRSLIKYAESCAQQLVFQLELQYPQPVRTTESRDVLDINKMSRWIKKVKRTRGCAEIERKRWQGKLIVDEECFAWLSDSKTVPIKTVVGLQ